MKKLRSVKINKGKVAGFLYFLNKGEGLPLHDHTEEDAHMIFVMAGSIDLAGPQIPAKILGQGQPDGFIYDLAPNSPHKFTAREDSTIIWNPVK